MPSDIITSKHQNDRFFSPDSMIWRVDREMVLLLAGGRALLMQLAHPRVAAGVAQHSHFKEDPLGRLYRTMSTMWSIVFDATELSRAALERVQNIHSKVRGTIPEAEPLPSKTTYDALDVELLLWVHATLVDSALVAYDAFVMPLTTEKRLRYYDDSKKLAYLFEIPATLVPRSLADFNSYLERMLASGEIAVGPTARALAEEILYPSLWILRPVSPLFRLITAGLLPESLRDAYGLRWSEPKEKTFWLVAKWIRRLRPFVPRALRIVPNTRVAEKTFSAHGWKSL